MIAERIQRYLSESNTSQTELATQLGVAQATVSRWVRGDMIPSRASMRRLAVIMGDDPEQAGRWVISASTTTERVEQLEREVAELRARLDALERAR